MSLRTAFKSSMHATQFSATLGDGEHPCVQMKFMCEGGLLTSYVSTDCQNIDALIDQLEQLRDEIAERKKQEEDGA